MDIHYELKSQDSDAFSLHDCRSSLIEYENNRLTFFFPAGIFCEDYGDDWPNTGAASVEYLVDPKGRVFLYLFMEIDGQTIRKEYSIEELIQAVNSGRWELEFAYRFDGYQEVLYTCWIWENQQPWTYEAQLFIGMKEEVFRYNPPRL